MRTLFALKEKLTEILNGIGHHHSFASLETSIDKRSVAALRHIEQFCIALLATAFFALVSRFVPIWVDALALIIVGAFGLTWAIEQIEEEYMTGVLAFLTLASGYFVLSQPITIVFVSAATGLIAGMLAAKRVDSDERSWFSRLASGSVYLTVVGVLVTALSFAALISLYVYILPVLHPITVWLYTISPALAALAALIIIGYASLRQPVGESNWYWICTPALSLLFAFFYWPSHSYVSAGAITAVGVALSLMAFSERQTEESSERSHFTLVVTTAITVGFVAWFIIANQWTVFREYEMANAITVTRHQLSDIPTTLNTRPVPRIAAQDYCAPGNHTSNTKFGSRPKIIAINANGHNKQYWECIRHPTRFNGHELLYATGGIEGFVLTDAGTRGKFAEAINEDFVFGDLSTFTRGAFAVRHPGSEFEPTNAVIGRDRSGHYKLLVPYVTRTLQWGGMIPDLGGVMVLSPWGVIEDMTPAQAAARYPGVPFMPDALVRQYADLWAQKSSLWDQYRGNLYEVSEVTDELQNKYPFWQNFQSGVRGVIPFEPQGKQSNSLASIALAAPSSLAFDLYQIPVSKDKDLTASSLDNDFPGPKQIVSNVALSHVGMNQIETVEALLVVSPCKQIFWSTALLQVDKARLYHGYSLNVVYGAHADVHKDVESTDQLDRFVADADKSLDKCKR